MHRNGRSFPGSRSSAGERWYGHGVEWAVSIVIVDEAGGVARTIVCPGALATPQAGRAR